MARIVAGLFDDQQGADDAIGRLGEGGAPVPQDAVASFVVNPPGMHGGLKAGPAVDADPQAHRGDEGAMQGAAIGAAAGAVAGLATVPLVGPAGAAAAMGAGAYVGALAGAFRGMGKADARSPAVRPGGIMVAVNVDAVPELRAIDALRDAGARMVEVEEGDWAEGCWRDFPALDPPRNVVYVRGDPGYPA